MSLLIKCSPSHHQQCKGKSNFGAPACLNLYLRCRKGAKKRGPKTAQVKQTQINSMALGNQLNPVHFGDQNIFAIRNPYEKFCIESPYTIESLPSFCKHLKSKTSIINNLPTRTLIEQVEVSTHHWFPSLLPGRFLEDHLGLPPNPWRFCAAGKPMKLMETPCLSSTGKVTTIPIQDFLAGGSRAMVMENASITTVTYLHTSFKKHAKQS